MRYHTRKNLTCHPERSPALFLFRRSLAARDAERDLLFTKSPARKWSPLCESCVRNNHYTVVAINLPTEIVNPSRSFVKNLVRLPSAHAFSRAIIALNSELL